MILRSDFHLHSCLSPCGDLAMSPRAIAQTLAMRGVHIAALTDHNSALNCPAFASACKEFGVIPLFGIEAQSLEECHILCLFTRLENALSFGEELYELLPPIINIPEKTGDQVFVDENDDILGEVEKYLITSVNLGLDELAEKAIQAGAIIIPAHADRAAFSLTSQLGFIPDGPWDALEVIRMPQSIDDCDTLNYHLTTSSDAHYIEHIGRRAFDLDIANDTLLLQDGTVNPQTIKAALLRRPTLASITASSASNSSS